jgi:hypothetical protein
MDEANSPLHAEVETPKLKRRTVWVATGTGVVGVAAGALACVLLLPPRIKTVVLTSPPERVVEHVPVVVPAAPPPSVTDVQMLFTVGSDSYVALGTDDLPKHGKATIVENAGAIVALAPVTAKTAWTNRTMIVDGACEATLTEFAVIARVAGSARDAGDGLTEWTANNVMEYGNPVLAAKIDGCTGVFARDASLPAITVLPDTTAAGASERLAEEALKLLTKSDLATKAQDAWREASHEGNWWEADDAKVETRIVRHPKSGEVFVVVHAYRFSDCGEVGGNLVGTYRVDGSSKLTTVKVDSSAMESLERVIDLENDGDVELVGSSKWDSFIDRLNGDTAATIGPSTYGCGC